MLHYSSYSKFSTIRYNAIQLLSLGILSDSIFRGLCFLFATPNDCHFHRLLTILPKDLNSCTQHQKQSFWAFVMSTYSSVSVFLSICFASKRCGFIYYPTTMSTEKRKDFECMNADGYVVEPCQLLCLTVAWG